MMSVLVSGAVPRGLTPAQIHDTVVATFKRAKRKPSGSLSVQFVSEQKIAELNATYRGKRKPTDVLSFSSREGSTPLIPVRELEWGDLFVCTPYAKREASRRRIALPEEIVRLISHGTLHLLGYDHATEVDEARMFGLQETVVEQITDHL